MALCLGALRLPPDDGLGNRPGNTHGDCLKHLGLHFTLVPTLRLSDIVSDLGYDGLSVLFASATCGEHKWLISNTSLDTGWLHVVSAAR